MGVKLLKVLLCSSLLGLFTLFVVRIISAGCEDVHAFYGWVFIFAGLAFGAYAAKYISWGWLLGGFGGLFSSFYVALFLSVMVWPDRSYEDGLGLLFISAVIGLVAGSYLLSRYFKKPAD